MDAAILIQSFSACISSHLATLCPLGSDSKDDTSLAGHPVGDKARYSTRGNVLKGHVPPSLSALASHLWHYLNLSINLFPVQMAPSPHFQFSQVQVQLILFYFPLELGMLMSSGSNETLYSSLLSGSELCDFKSIPDFRFPIKPLERILTFKRGVAGTGHT